MKDYEKLVLECRNELDALDIPYAENITFEINSRSKRRWGLCCREYGGYRINISATLLDDSVPTKSTKQVIIHELLHTVPNGMSHTGTWKKYAEIVNRSYGYDVTRTDSANELGVSKSLQSERVVTHNKTYVCECEKCGARLTRHRISDFVKYPFYYEHTNCGGKFKRVI